MESTLINNSSFHPTLSLTLAATLLTTPSSRDCTPSILVHLPPGIFYDPFTASNPIITQGRSRKGYKIVHLAADEVELEGAVGYSTRRKHGKGKGKDEQWWERKEVGFVEERETDEGLKVQQMLQEAILDKAREITGEGKRSKVIKKEKGGVEETGGREEVSTLLIELNVDELLRADGMKAGKKEGLKVDVPLHLRYQQPKKSSTTRTWQSGALPSPHSSYATLLDDILALHSFTRAKEVFFSLFSNTTSSSDAPITSSTSATPQLVETALNPAPTLFLTCENRLDPGPDRATKFVEGFYSTSLSTLFPRTHSHLLPAASPQNQGTVLALSQTKAKHPPEGLKLNVPVPDATLLAPVQLTTLVTLVSAALVVVYHLLSSVVPALEGVEKTL